MYRLLAKIHSQHATTDEQKQKDQARKEVHEYFCLRLEELLALSYQNYTFKKNYCFDLFYFVLQQLLVKVTMVRMHPEEL